MPAKSFLSMHITTVPGLDRTARGQRRSALRVQAPWLIIKAANLKAGCWKRVGRLLV
jgi:hypothetical protein